MQAVRGAAVSYLVFDKLRSLPHLRHGVSLRRAGGTSDDVDFSPGQPAKARRHIKDFCHALDIRPDHLARVSQVHGVEVVTAAAPFPSPPAADALCTNRTGLGLMLLGADCPLLLVYDPQAGALGLAHSGWRGAMGRIAYRLVRHMETAFGCQPSTMLAGIGPAICGDCYEVGADVIQIAQQLPAWDQFLTIKDDDQKGRLDLSKAIIMQLVEAGLPSKNIETSGFCTFEQENLFPSYRRDGAQAGRWALLAALVA